MSKAILVIDMPNSCDECQFNKEHHLHNTCILTGYWITTENFKDDFCPLKHAPKKHSECEVNDYWVGYDSGYNACLEEILEQ